MSAPERVRFARLEHERRFLVAGDSWREGVGSTSRLIEDLYLDGTLLRLRVMTDSGDGQRMVKLSKKYPSASRYVRSTTTTILDPAEHVLLDALPGHRLRKRRHYREHAGMIFCIDVFEGALAGLILSEVEADDLATLMAIPPPPWAEREVTEDSAYDGGSLCRNPR